MTPEIASATPDPIRTRMFFLALASPDRRREIVRSAIENTRMALTAAERRRTARPTANGSGLQRLASEGVLYELRARLDWLMWLAGELHHLER
jgi:hypothetical protein